MPQRITEIRNLIDSATFSDDRLKDPCGVIVTPPQPASDSCDDDDDLDNLDNLGRGVG
jgi:hypothetical protein